MVKIISQVRDDYKAMANFLLQKLDPVKDYILPVNPFETLDQEGIGQLMEIAIKKGQSVRPEIKLGICGEHGGDTESVKFCHKLGLNYVSCSPFRVPVARLAAAQAMIEEQEQIKKDCCCSTCN